MRITKSRLKEIILEELDEGSREDMMMPAMSQSDLKIAELEERVERLEGMVGGGLEEGQPLHENVAMLAQLAPAIIGFVAKNPELLKTLAAGVAPLIMGMMGGAGGGAAEE